MASDSPGGNPIPPEGSQNENNHGLPPVDPPRSAQRAGARSSLSERVGFFEQVWKSRQRSRSKGKESKRSQSGRNQQGTSSAVINSGGSRITRVEVAYHGPRTDARDRSSEDPKRHRIPRASLSPTGSPITVPDEEGLEEELSIEKRKKIRTRSVSKGREMDRRVSRERSLERERRRSKERISRAVEHETNKIIRDRSEGRNVDYEAEFQKLVDQQTQQDDIAPYKSIQIKRTQSGRMIESQRGGGSSNSIVHSRSEYKPRALSFRVSPAKHIATLEHQATHSDVSGALHDVHHKMQPIFHHSESTRDSNISISKHIQSKVSTTSSLAQTETRQQRHSSVDFQYERPPPLPERPPRHQRQSEPALFPSMQSGDLTSSEMQRGMSRTPDYHQVSLLHKDEVPAGKVSHNGITN